ncbi:MAG TPA: YqgE/AlgH family protein [Planctomycetes bacterium]|nr:YqgE/AlgH family protein [Planctomycetota bacterium]
MFEEFDSLGESEIEAGDLLIATPMLRDPNFHRTVILICDHDQEGSFGLVINRPTQIPVDRVLEEMDAEGTSNSCVQFGGPVESDKVFALCHGHGHSQQDREVGSGIFLPEDLHRSIERIRSGSESVDHYLFFLGYSGWGAGQLEQEVREQSWVLSKRARAGLLQTPADQMWAEALREMGGQQTLWSWMPPDPDMN